MTILKKLRNTDTSPTPKLPTYSASIAATLKLSLEPSSSATTSEGTYCPFPEILVGERRAVYCFVHATEAFHAKRYVLMGKRD